LSSTIWLYLRVVNIIEAWGGDECGDA